MSTEKPPATAPVDAVVMRQIEHWLATWDEPGNEARMRFESAREYWDRALQPMFDDRMKTKAGYAKWLESVARGIDEGGR